MKKVKYKNMRTEIITLTDAQLIGIAKEIAFNEAHVECPKHWAENYVERIVKPVFIEKKAPDDYQKAALDNMIGEFGLCTCDIPNHNCATCAEQNFGACSKTFTYVIAGMYKGGDVPEGMRLFPLKSARWLKVYFVGGMKAFQEQFKKFHTEWLPLHPEYRWAGNSSCLEWYGGGPDVNSPDYQCGVMMPLEDM